MRKTFAAFAVSATLLGGCGTLGDPNATQSLIQAIQTDAAAICSVIPAAADVAILLSGQNPAAVSASIIAGAICKAFTTQKPAALAAARRGVRRGSSYLVTVNGVPVHVVAR